MKWLRPAAWASISAAGPAERPRVVVDRLGDAVAQPDRPGRGVPPDRDADPVLRVGVVEHERGGRELRDVRGDLDHERHRPKGVRQPAGSAVLRQDAGEPVAQRQVVVGLPRRDPVDRDRRHDEVCARQRLAALGRRVDGHVPAGRRVEALGKPGHPGQRLRIRVDQPQLGTAELLDPEHVAEQLDAEDDAADADGDELHGAAASTTADFPISRMPEA